MLPGASLCDNLERQPQAAYEQIGSKYTHNLTPSYEFSRTRGSKRGKSREVDLVLGLECRGQRDHSHACFRRQPQYICILVALTLRACSLSSALRRPQKNKADSDADPAVSSVIFQFHFIAFLPTLDLFYYYPFQVYTFLEAVICLTFTFVSV